jgi:hypothetical protein
MSVGFIYAFCLSKLIYTGVFGCIVVSHGMSNDMRGAVHSIGSGGSCFVLPTFLQALRRRMPFDRDRSSIH